MSLEQLVFSSTHNQAAILFPIDDLLLLIPRSTEEKPKAIHYEKNMPVDFIDFMKISGEAIVGVYEVYKAKENPHHEKEVFGICNEARSLILKNAKMK